MLRAIQEIQPRYVVGENVRGIISWNGGLVFDEVQADLEAEGYTVIPCVLPACGVNAPHRRERVWFVAYSDNTGNNTPKCGNIGNGAKDSTERKYSQYEFGGQSLQGINSDTGLQRQAERQKQTMGINELCEEQFTPNTESKQSEWLQFEQRKLSKQEQRELRRSHCKICHKRNVTYTRCSEWQNWIYGQEQAGKATKFGDSYTKFGRFVEFPTTEPTIRGGNDGIPRELDGITFPKWRSESIKAYGNAIVPQVAYEIFKVIDKLDKKLLRYL